MKKKKENLKSEYAEKLIASGIQKYSVVRHSYTNNRLNGEIDRVQNTNRDLSPTLDTRCDCLGVVVGGLKRYKNCITWRNKRGAFNTECNRASLGDDLSLTLATNDMAKVALEEEEMLRIRKLTPNECIRLMGFENCDEKSMREIGMSDSRIYHCAGDSIVVSVLIGLFGQLLPIDEKELLKCIEEYTDSLAINKGAT